MRYKGFLYLLFCLTVFNLRLYANDINPGDFISISETQKLISENNKSVKLVDIRAKTEFERYSINGSELFPLFSIKTKPFLRSFQLILVTRGFEYGTIKSELDLLVVMGFKVKILKGGIFDWKKRNGLLKSSDNNNSDRQEYILPEDFILEKDYSHWIKINMASDISSESDIFTDSIHISESLKDEEFIMQYNELIQKRSNPDLTCVLIYNKDGVDYEKTAKKLPLRDNVIVFYLQGGLDNYEKYLQKKEAILHSGSIQVQSKPCKSCP